LIGSLVGGGATIGGFFIKHCLDEQARAKRDEPRKSLLRKMLSDPGPDGWRKFETLSRVIGADASETARLLVEVGARGSETGNNVWAFIKDKPLPKD